MNDRKDRNERYERYDKSPGKIINNTSNNPQSFNLTTNKINLNNNLPKHSRNNSNSINDRERPLSLFNKETNNSNVNNNNNVNKNNNLNSNSTNNFNNINNSRSYNNNNNNNNNINNNSFSRNKLTKSIDKDNFDFNTNNLEINSLKNSMESNAYHNYRALTINEMPENIGKIY